MKVNPIASAFSPLLLTALAATAAAQNTPRAPLPPLPAPLAVPNPGSAGDAPYASLPILQGGVVVTLYPPGSPYLKAERIRE